MKQRSAGRAAEPASATWSVQDAKNSFSAVLKAAERQPQTVTKHGRPAAVVVSAEEFERLRGLDDARKPSFVDMLLAMPKSDYELERMEAEFRDPEF